MSNTRARKPGGGRKPSKPEYSAAKNLAQQMKAAADLFITNFANHRFGFVVIESVFS